MKSRTLRGLTLLCLLVGMSPLAAEPDLIGVLRGIELEQGFLRVDEQRYALASDVNVRNFDGSDSLQALRKGQPLRYSLDANGQIRELWAYPSDSRKQKGALSIMDTNH